MRLYAAWLGAVTLGCGSAQAPPSAQSSLLGRPAPDFARPTLDDRRFDSTGTRGRVLVVEFMASYCAPCRRSLPAFEAYHREHPELVLVGVSEDARRADAVDWMRQYGLSFPVVLDADNALSGRFRVAALPTTFVIDPQGVVRWVGDAGAAPGGLAGVLASVL